MNQRRVCTLLASIVLLATPGAGAQDRGRTGITMGYPAAVGVVWHATDRVAIRPELQFSSGTTEASIPDFSGGSSRTWSVGVGVSALFYLRQWETLRTYVAPRFSYLKGRSTVELSGPFGGENVQDTSSRALSGLFGAQYSPHPRFSVFGEVGLGFVDQHSSSSSTPVQSNSHSWSTRTGVGVVFYF